MHLIGRPDTLVATFLMHASAVNHCHWWFFIQARNYQRVMLKSLKSGNVEKFKEWNLRIWRLFTVAPVSRNAIAFTKPNTSCSIYFFLHEYVRRLKHNKTKSSGFGLLPMSAVFLTRSPSNSRRWENTSLAGSFLIRSANPRTMGQIQTGWWDKYRRNNRTNTKGQIGPLSLDCFHMWLRSAETWLAELPITSWIVIGRSPIGADAPDRRSLPVQPEPPTDQDDHYGAEGGDHFDNDDQ